MSNSNKRKADLANVKRSSRTTIKTKPAFSSGDSRRAYMFSRRSNYGDWKKLLKNQGEEHTKTYVTPPGILPHASESGLSDVIDDVEDVPQKKVVKKKKVKANAGD